MARKKIIEPDIWKDEKFGCLSLLGKVVYIGLFSNSDDEGRGYASPRYLKATLLPYDDFTKIEDVEYACREIVSLKMKIIFYKTDEKIYYQFLKYREWQRPEKPTPSKIPAYDGKTHELQFGEYSTTIRRLFDDYSTTIRKDDENADGYSKNDLSLSSKDLSIKELSIKEYDLKKKNTQKKKPDLVENDVKSYEKQDLLLDDDVFIQRFNRFWSAYGNKKGSKAKCLQWFKTRKVSEKLLNDMLLAIDIDNNARQQAIANNKFYPEKPFPQTWINQRRWETILENASSVASNEQVDGGNENISPTPNLGLTGQGNQQEIDIDKLIADYEAEKKAKR